LLKSQQDGSSLLRLVAGPNLLAVVLLLAALLLRRRELFRLPEDVTSSLTFGCKEPMSGTHLKLEGMGAFDAAVHCASVARG